MLLEYSEGGDYRIFLLNFIIKTFFEKRLNVTFINFIPKVLVQMTLRMLGPLALWGVRIKILLKSLFQD